MKYYIVLDHEYDNPPVMIISDVYSDDMVRLIENLYNKHRYSYKAYGVFYGNCILFDEQRYEFLTIEELIEILDDEFSKGQGWLYTYGEDAKIVQDEIEELRVLVKELSNEGNV